MGGKIHNQQKETNRLSYVDNLNHHNDVNLTEMWVSEKEKRKENIRNGWLLDVPVNIVEDSPIRVVGVGVGQVFSTNIAGRETSFESLSNESRLQEMPVENVVELARQASPLQAQHSPMSTTHVKNQAEAVSTRDVGHKLGVIFESADEVVVDRLLELVEKETAN
ncbi:hypothetical protein V6N13_074098 [Hibiscus sabdariffa]